MRKRTYLTVTASFLLGGCLGGDDSSSGGMDASDSYGNWFDDVGNFDGETALTGEDRVSVSVGGASGLLFEPPAIRISPGTTVTWEWTGQGGLHNVQAESGAFESQLYNGADARFEYTFEDPALYR